MIESPKNKMIEGVKKKKTRSRRIVGSIPPSDETKGAFIDSELYKELDLKESK